MSPTLEHTETEWLAQYAALRRTLAELRVEQPNSEAEGYGHDIVLEDEDHTGSSSSDDLWNMFGDDEQDGEYSSDMLDGVTDSPNSKSKSAYPYEHEWLRRKCLALGSSNLGMDAEELQQKLSAILVSDMRGLNIRLSVITED